MFIKFLPSKVYAYVIDYSSLFTKINAPLVVIKYVYYYYNIVYVYGPKITFVLPTTTAIFMLPMNCCCHIFCLYILLFAGHSIRSLSSKCKVSKLPFLGKQMLNPSGISKNNHFRTFFVNVSTEFG